MVRLRQLIDAHNAALSPGSEPLTQRKLAELVGTSEAHVSRHINGESQMLYETAQRYARVFSVDVAQIDDRFATSLNWHRCQSENVR